MPVCQQRPEGSPRPLETKAVKRFGQRLDDNSDQHERGEPAGANVLDVPEHACTAGVPRSGRAIENVAPADDAREEAREHLRFIRHASP